MKYLAMLSVLFFVGCATVSETGTKSSHSSYQDYTYTDKSGNVKVHRVYTNGHQEWLNQAESMSK